MKNSKPYWPHSFIRNSRLLACVLLCAAAFVSAAPIVGIGTHFGQGKSTPDEFFSWVDQTPFTSIRDEMYWADNEKRRGELSLGNKSKQSLLAFRMAKARGMQPLLILSYGNPFYQGGTQPSTPESQAAFARYASWVGQLSNGIVDHFEIWNEWNIGAGNRPPSRYGDPAAYVSLAKLTSSALKKANPNATVLGGALGDDLPDWPWLKQAIDLGLLSAVDGISVHLYNYSTPTYRGGAKEFEHRLIALDRLLKAKSKGKGLPIYVTEVGWPNDATRSGVSQRDAMIQGTEFLMMARALPSIKGIWFYEYQDEGSDPLNRELHFGLRTVDGKDKPLACALVKTQSALAGSTLVSDVDDGKIRTQLYDRPDGKRLLAVWQNVKGPFTAKTLTSLRGSFSTTPTSIGIESCVKENASSFAGATKSDLLFDLTDMPMILLLSHDSDVYRK